jgi:hypothetical protein
MVYVIHGWIGLEKFRNERLAATSTLGDFKDGNCFHDGSRRLRVVDQCLDQILEERRRSDNISQPLVYMVKDMLHEHPAARPACLGLYHRANALIKEVKDKFHLHQAIPSNSPQPIPQARAPPGPPPNHPNEVPGSPYSHQLSSYVSAASTPSSKFTGIVSTYPPHIRPALALGLSTTSEPMRSDQFGGFPIAAGSPSEPISSMEDILTTSYFPTTPPPIQQPAENGTPMSKGKTKELETPPRWPVEESLAWKKDHKRKKSRTGFSRIFTSDKNKYLDVEGKTHLKELKNRDHVSRLRILK